MESTDMKVAIVHYWLVACRGGEKVVEELCRIFPHADVYTHVLNRENLFPHTASKTIRTTFINRLPYACRWYQYYLPLMPLALEQLDLRGYDLVISSESGPAKGVITGPDCLHICYCHTPMRYVWDMSHEYTASQGVLKRIMMAPLLHYLRMWDRLSADRVDYFIANSDNVRRRIQKHYRRDATVIHPPLDVGTFGKPEGRGDYYLLAGQLVPYKRADLAVRAFSGSGKRLVVIGEGEQFKELRDLAGPGVEVLGRQSDEDLRMHFRRCRALIFPGEEDFGMVPVEAMASGRPVIAYARGGALETVIEGKTGIFFNEQTENSLMDAVERFETMEKSYNSEAIRTHAATFDRERFQVEIRAFVEGRLESSRKKPAETLSGRG